MPTVWISLKKTLHCKTDPSEVHEPKPKSKQSKQSRHLGSILAKNRPCRSGCTRSIANLKDVVVHGGKKPVPVSSSPRSIGSTEFSNPITHEVVLTGTKCELRITGIGHEKDLFEGGTLRPGTPGPGWAAPDIPAPAPAGTGGATPLFMRCSTTPTRRSNWLLKEGELGFGNVGRASCYERARPSNSGMICQKCGEVFGKLEALETHHLSKHAVTELLEGDSSRRIVEIICKAGWPKPDNPLSKIERVLKVHNMHRTLTRFEEYRESVKVKAGKLSKKHPRCLADGNELLRFYGTSFTCSLGTINGTATLCGSSKCNVCRIIRNGFSVKKDLKGGIGVFTTATSMRALEMVEITEMPLGVRKCLIVCRVIAGRVHKPIENLEEVSISSQIQTGFDSVAGKVGMFSNIEELYLLNAKALLPCFVVVCKS
ncbi:hypothetical protein LUZ60_017418 [Juncus effusus]|nr:hypothetical protein LUZ60_017418 [Juncus effusus]